MGIRESFMQRTIYDLRSAAAMKKRVTKFGHFIRGKFHLGSYTET